MNPIHKQIAAIVSQALQIPEVVYNRLNIIPHTSAIHPQFLKYQHRLNSFREWRYMGQASPEYLAESGFFCINEADTVKCFCCGLTLQGWKRDFNPDEQHKHYRKRCLYLCLKENTHPELDHLKTCIICMEKKSHYAFLPCGHICACHECLIQIVKCPLCNGDIAGVIKVYI